MKRYHSLAAVLCAGALTLGGLAGCSSSGGSSDDGTGGNGGGSPTAAATSPAFTGSPVKVGIIAPFAKAAFGNPQPEIKSAAMAAADAINQAGGLNGHELQVVACDDEYDPNKSAECGRTMVSQGVVAVVGSQTTQYAAYGPIIEKAGIPNIGSLPLGATDYSDTKNYPLVSGGVGLFAGDVIGAKMQGKKSVAMMGLSTAGGDAQAQLIQGIASAVGIQFKGYKSLPTDSSDLSPAVQSAEKTGADVVIMGLDKVSTRQFMVATQSAGAKYTLAHSPEVLTPDTLEAAPDAAEGMILASPFPPFSDTSFPGLVEYNKEMDAREATGDKGASKDNRQTVLITWMAFHAFGEIAKGVTGDFTPKSVTAAVEAAKDIDLGVGYKWTPSAKNIPNFPAMSNDNIYFSTVKDGKVVLSSPNPVHVLGGK